MLSLKPAKPAADVNQPDLETVRRQVSAQQALSREVSEPAVIVAASDDQLKRPTPDASDNPSEPSSTTTPEAPQQDPNGGPQQPPSSTPVALQQYPSSGPQPAAGVVTLPGETPDAAAAIVKQPSNMTKRFGFLSSLRRGSTAGEGSSAMSAQVAATPQGTPQDPPQQSEGTVLTQSEADVSSVLPAGEQTNKSSGVQQRGFTGQQGAALGVQQGDTLGCQLGAALAPTEGPQTNPVSAAPIELPPVFEYGSEGEEAQHGQVPSPPLQPPPRKSCCALHEQMPHGNQESQERKL